MRVHLVDGTFELFRAHYSKRPDHFVKGRDLKATVGVIQSLVGLFLDSKEQVTHLAIAFDNPIRSFRNDLFAAYKSDEGVVPVLRSQFDDVEEAAAALGVVVWSMREFEADDALATAARKFSQDPAVQSVRILTPDKDLGQCLTGQKVLQVDRVRRRVIDEESFRRDWGIAPESVPDFLALTGDTADGIPGLDGWGEKSASAVLGKYLHLEAIPAHPTAWEIQVRGAERLASVLDAQRDDAMLYRKLATLRDDVPLTSTLAELEWKGPKREVFTSWAERLEATSLIERMPRWRD